MLELGREDSGSRHSVRVGDEILIRLPERPTGYQWRPSLDEAKVEIVADSMEAEPTPRGASGQHVFTFRVLAVGSTTLRLQKTRSSDGPSVDDFEVALDCAT
jgi:predicted secreted protein